MNWQLPQVGTTFESNSGFEPIPDNTQLKACVTEAKWDSWEDSDFIKLRWDVLEGEFKGRVVFQKVRVAEKDQTKRDKAMRMLAAIDANCGGGLMRLGAEPKDQDLMVNLCNKPMLIKVLVWEINGNSGNWVCAVSPLTNAAPVAAHATPPSDDSLDSIPF